MSFPRWQAARLLSASFMATSLLGCLNPRSDESSPEVNECASCHGGQLPAPFEAAPPYNLAGDSEPSDRGNGAHEIHLSGSDRARAVACEECHTVPEETDSPGHIDTPYPAELIFSGPARAFKAEPFFEVETQSCRETFCHGSSFVGGRDSGGTLLEPSWLDQSGEPSECGSCHGLPPPAPHPPSEECSDCHKNIRADGTFSHPHLHVNGVVNFNLPSSEN